MKNQTNNNRGRKGKSVHNKIHEFYLKELEQKRQDQLAGKQVEKG